MKKEIKKDEYGYIPRYQNLHWGKDNEYRNKLMDRMANVYCRWYGSAYSLTSNEVSGLWEKIKRGETSFTKWKQNFDDNAYKAISGHTLTEERQKKKEFKDNYIIVCIPKVIDDDGEGGFLWESILFKKGNLEAVKKSIKLFENRKLAKEYFSDYWKV